MMASVTRLVAITLTSRVIRNFRHVISAASNRQSQMKDWDFLFDQSEQLRLQWKT